MKVIYLSHAEVMHDCLWLHELMTNISRIPIGILNEMSGHCWDKEVVCWKWPGCTEMFSPLESLDSKHITSFNQSYCVFLKAADCKTMESWHTRFIRASFLICVCTLFRLRVNIRAITAENMWRNFLFQKHSVNKDLTESIMASVMIKCFQIFAVI